MMRDVHCAGTRTPKSNIALLLWATLFSGAPWQRGGGIDASATLMRTESRGDERARGGPYKKRSEIHGTGGHVK